MLTDASIDGCVTWLPFRKPFFKPLRSCVPILYKLFSLFLISNGYLGVGPFSLGDTHLLTGGIHKEIGVIYHFQLEGHLLKFFNGIMIKFFCALANLTGCPINTIGQNASPIPSRRTIFSTR